MSEVAKTIIAQLGGKAFAIITGSKEFVFGENRVTFKVGAGTKNKAKWCRITLNGNDLYDVAFLKWNARKLETVIISKDVDVFCGDLQYLFTERTGFYCTM